MARTKALSLLQAAATKSDLAEIYGIVIDNVMKDTLSSSLKSQAYTGNPAAGSVEFKRFENSEAKTYGTARTAGKGDSITAPPITVNLDTHHEIVEECAKFDLDTFGVSGIMARRASNHIDTMTTDLDTAFFAVACDSASVFTSTSTDPLDVLEEAILKLETVKNKHVRGTNRINHRLILSPSYYSTVRNKLDSVINSNVDTAAEEFGMFHGVKIYSTINLPDDIDFLIMHNGAVAQPAIVNPYSDPEKIPLSNDFAVSLFYDYGTKVLTPDLIFKKESE
ncbi:MAG: hypothetical protein K2G63_03360 [Oscillospiraceae bacterium]|nr:hypothetical protein [Oscillospiraceae bacterium]